LWNNFFVGKINSHKSACYQKDDKQNDSNN
jgi:hypothetical protein